MNTEQPVELDFNDAINVAMDGEKLEDEPTMSDEEWQAMLAKMRSEFSLPADWAGRRPSRHAIARRDRAIAKRKSKKKK